LLIYKAKFLCRLTLVLAAGLAGAQVSTDPSVPAAIQQISPDALRAHVAFLASDSLEGRATPSHGADIAAEYIATQFRLLGLDPIAGNSYFQDQLVTNLRRRLPSEPSGPVRVRNVIGVLRGADPQLAGSCIIVSAHYDHLGLRPDLPGDSIFNGANDDASGTAAVIEIARALRALNKGPRRTLIFAAFGAEERGRIGSRYYAEHPACPIQQTIADINLEQLGRTDDVTGPVIGAAYVTGYDYSDLGPFLTQEGRKMGIQFLKHESNSDKFFSGSDNFSLALAGVPAHTVSVGYIFPDYHRPGDHWDKLDYDNMARVVRALALAVEELANRDQPVEWNPTNPLAEPYRKARSASVAAP
jgi:hypothetical protein